MAEFAMRSFCKDCGQFRQTMPFGSSDPFWDREPCRRCGSSRYGRCVVASKRLISWLPLKFGWFDREGVRVDVAATQDNQKGDGDV